MKAVILVPRRAGFADRDRLWEFARTWWENDFPDWTIYEGEGPRVGPFNRGAALNEAAKLAGDWDVAVLIDGDVLCDPHAVRAGVTQAGATNGPVLAYHERVHLTRQGTEAVIAGFRGNWKKKAFQPYIYDACSSAVIVSRKLWDAVGGFDETFVGWGWEDVAFRCATETMSGQELVTISSTIYHLWHRTSRENNRDQKTFRDNEKRGNLYVAARMNKPRMEKLLAEASVSRVPIPEAEPRITSTSAGSRISRTTRIPRILHRTVPEKTGKQVEAWWKEFEAIHPGWELLTHRDPLRPSEWPMTADLWSKCKSGAQLAGLIRLEALAKWGGVYVDSDVEPYRSLEPLLGLSGFAAWEDNKVVPDAVLGAEPGHPAVKLMIGEARKAVAAGKGPWESGPGVCTKILPGRDDWLLLPPGTFYPYHYTVKEKLRSKDHMAEQPWSFGAHHWHFSWEADK